MPMLARPTKRLVGILLWVIARGDRLSLHSGSQSKAVQGISILLGVMVSIGSSGFVGNIISGIVLTYARSFTRRRSGEDRRARRRRGKSRLLRDQAAQPRGTRRSLFPTARSRHQPIVNYTRLGEDSGLVLHTEVTIGYDADWRAVHAPADRGGEPGRGRGARAGAVGVPALAQRLPHHLRDLLRHAAVARSAAALLLAARRDPGRLRPRRDGDPLAGLPRPPRRQRAGAAEGAPPARVRHRGRLGTAAGRAAGTAGR